MVGLKCRENGQRGRACLRDEEADLGIIPLNVQGIPAVHGAARRTPWHGAHGQHGKRGGLVQHGRHIPAPNLSLQRCPSRGPGT